MLRQVVDATFGAVENALAEARIELRCDEVGSVSRLTSDVAEVRGLAAVTAGELLEFPQGLVGMATDIEVDKTGAILLGPSAHLNMGDTVRRLRRAVSVPTGRALLGRVVDALGRPLDGRGTIAADRIDEVEKSAPEIMDRAPVSVPLQTGIKAIDAAIPVGRGQRELIVGDRQAGKTAIAVDTILNQKGSGVVSVYCAIGQRGDAVARVIDTLKSQGALEQCVVVVAGGEDTAGLQYMAPFAATSIGERFMDEGRDVLIVYDDLTRHARAYRELSLLLRRPPGREAFPGDIFYLHARLLERATHLRRELGGGSLTALPIIETQAQNLSDYIPTNLISITDGQIYLSPTLFQKGQLPPVDIGKSVSRVGGKAQLPAFRAVAGPLRLAYAQFEELEAFARFGTRLDDETRRRLDRGRRVREILKQPESAPIGVVQQIAVLLAVTEGVFDAVALDDVARAEKAIQSAVGAKLEKLSRRIEAGGELSDADRQRILEVARAAVADTKLAADHAES